MKLDPRSEQNLEGVHQDLRRLVAAVEPPYPVVIVEGVRNLEQQREYVRTGASNTMNSRHLTGHAIDFVVFPKGVGQSPTWDLKYYEQVAKEFRKKAKELGIPVTWGGHWDSRDCMHLQLSWEAYPIAQPQFLTSTKTSTTIAAAGGIGAVSIISPILEILERAESPMVEYVALGTVLALAGYIIRERIMKIHREGQ